MSNMDNKNLFALATDIESTVSRLEEDITALDSVQENLDCESSLTASDNMRAIAFCARVPGYIAQLAVITRDLHQQREHISRAVEDLYTLQDKAKETAP